MNNLLLIFTLLLGQNNSDSFILLVDDEPNSRLLLHELNECKFEKVPEELKSITEVQKSLREAFIVVHYLDIEKLKKYKLKEPEKYPAVRLNRYKKFDYFEELSFGSRTYALLSLKQIVERNWNEELLSQWKLDVEKIIQENNREYDYEVVLYIQNHENNSEFFYGSFNVEAGKKKFGHLADFPIKKSPKLPPKPIVNLYPWQENYILTPIVLDQNQGIKYD